MHEWMMLVKYGGINPGPCGPLLLLKAADIMVWVMYFRNGGRKKDRLEFILPTEEFKGWLKNFETMRRWQFPCLLHHHSHIPPPRCHHCSSDVLVAVSLSSSSSLSMLSPPSPPPSSVIYLIVVFFVLSPSSSNGGHPSHRIHHCLRYCPRRCHCLIVVIVVVVIVVVAYYPPPSQDLFDCCVSHKESLARSLSCKESLARSLSREESLAKSHSQGGSWEETHEGSLARSLLLQGVSREESLFCEESLARSLLLWGSSREETPRGDCLSWHVESGEKTSDRWKIRFPNLSPWKKTQNHGVTHTW